MPALKKVLESLEKNHQWSNLKLKTYSWVGGKGHTTREAAIREALYELATNIGQNDPEGSLDNLTEMNVEAFIKKAFDVNSFEEIDDEFPVTTEDVMKQVPAVRTKIMNETEFPEYP